MIVRPTPTVVAALLVLMLKRYGEERGKVVNRARFSRKTMLRVSGRKKNLRGAFLEQLSEALADLGYAFIQDEPDFGVMLIDTSGWTKIAARRRIADEIRALRAGRLSEQDLLDLLGDEDIPDDEEGTED